MRAVFFDLDGTLVELPDDFLDLFETAMADHAISTDVEHAEFYIEEFFGHLADCHPEPYRMAMAALREEYDFDPSAEVLAETYTEREAEMTDLADGCREAFDELTSQAGDAGSQGESVDSSDSDVALGVLTNGGARGQHRKLTHHGIADYFEEVVVSSDVGTGKPDAKIFAAAKQAIPADEYVFVADDLERDVLPAQEAGFTGVLLADEDDVADADEDDIADAGEADATVSSLQEIPQVLD